MISSERSRYGLVVSALGAIVLVVSVFLPWYGVSLTASGVSLAQSFSDQVAAQFGNATLQSSMSGVHASLGGLAGQEFVALSAHQALSDLNVILLVLAGLALLDALIALARGANPVPAGAGAGASVVVLGALATLCVAYRMIDPPTPGGGLMSLSLREGAWLALLGAMAVMLGGLWPRIEPAGAASDAQLLGTWSSLSGWTPS